MRKLKVGDKVTWEDPSYSFGIRNGEYNFEPRVREIDTREFSVIYTGLRAMRNCYGSKDGHYPEVCDILVTDNDGGFWFTQSRFVELCSHTITIDDKTITISNESYKNLKKQLND